VPVQEAAKVCFNEYDSARFKEEQKQITNILMQLRIGFVENELVDGIYRTDLRLLGTNTSVLLKNKHSLNKLVTEDGVLPGLDLVKEHWLKNMQGEDMRLQEFDLENWSSLTEKEKYSLVATLLPA
jgi:hypothetical protein